MTSLCYISNLQPQKLPTPSWSNPGSAHWALLHILDCTKWINAAYTYIPQNLSLCSEEKHEIWTFYFPFMKQFAFEMSPQLFLSPCFLTDHVFMERSKSFCNVINVSLQEVYTYLKNNTMINVKLTGLHISAYLTPLQRMCSYQLSWRTSRLLHTETINTMGLVKLPNTVITLNFVVRKVMTEKYAPHPSSGHITVKFSYFLLYKSFHRC